MLFRAAGIGGHANELGFRCRPSNRTVPIKSPPPTAPVSGGAPPPFALELETQIARVRVNRESSLFSGIQIHLIRDSCWQTLFLWPHAGQNFVVSAAIAGCECGAVLTCGPATHLGARLLGACGGPLISVSVFDFMAEPCRHRNRAVPRPERQSLSLIQFAGFLTRDGLSVRRSRRDCHHPVNRESICRLLGG